MRDSCDELTAELPMLLRRHEAFWQRAPTDRPLVGCLPVKTWSARPYPLTGGRLAAEPQAVRPDDLDAGLLAGRDLPLPPLLLGDLVNTVGYRYPQACMEAIIGCPICVSAYGCVARPAVAGIDEALATFSPAQALRSPWLPLFRAVLAEVRALADEAYPVCSLHLRGVVDMLAAYLGEEALCLALVDAPEKVEELAGRFATVFLAVVNEMLPLCGTWRQGMVSAWQVYAPGPLLDYQIDATSLLSPALYARHLLRYDLAVLARFRYSVLHLHACGLQMLAELLPCANVAAIEVSADREATPWDAARFTDDCRAIQQQGKPLIVFSEFSPDEYRDFTAALDLAGLAICCWGASRTEAYVSCGLASPGP